MSLTFQICVILAVFPVIFLYYLKHHPEKIDEYAVRPTRQKIVHKLLFWFLGFSVFSVYLLAFSIGFSVVTTDIAVAYDAVENYPMNSERPSGYTDDNLFTKDGYQKPDGDIIESLEKHNSSYAINFNAPETKNKDKDGTPLYSDLDNKGINLDLTVSDTYSGIKSISVEVSAPYDTAENFKHKVTVGKNAKDSGALTYDNSGTRENDWVITDTDENLATEMKNTNHTYPWSYRKTYHSEDHI